MVRADAGRRSGPSSTIGGAFHALLGGNAAVATVAPLPRPSAARAATANGGSGGSGGRRAPTSAEGDGDHFRVKPVRCRGVSARVVLQNANGPCPLLALVNVLALRGHLSLPSGASFAAGADLVTALRDWLFATTTGRAEADPAVAAAVADAAGRLPALRTGVDVNIRFGAVGAVEFSAEVGLFDLFGVRLLHGWVVDPGDAEVAALVGPLSYNGLVELLCAPEEEAEEERAVGVTVGMAPDVMAGTGVVEEGAIAAAAPAATDAATLGEEEVRGGAAAAEAAVADMERPVAHEEATAAVATAPAPAATTSAETRGDVTAGSLADTVTVERDGTDDFCCADVTAANAVTSATDEETVAGGSAVVDEVAVDATVDADEAAAADSSQDVVATATLAPAVPVSTLAVPTAPATSAIADTAVDTAVSGLSSAAALPPPPVTPSPTAPATPWRSRQALARAFLSASPSQLTPYGLAALHGALSDGELAVLFRNNHLSTITRHAGELYLLVSDVGYLHQRGIVWERLDSVSGDSAFFSGDFVAFGEGAGELGVRPPADAAGEAAELAAAVAASQADAPPAEGGISVSAGAAAVADDDGNDDAALARALQAEEDSLRAAAATSDADARLARRLHDEEQAAAAAAAAAPPSARLAGGARRGGGGGRGGGGRGGSGRGGRGGGGRPAGQPPRHRAAEGGGRLPHMVGRGGAAGPVRQPPAAAPPPPRASSALDSSSCVLQ